MSILSDTLSTGDSTTIPGWTISAFTLAEIADIEAYLERRHLKAAALAAQELPPMIGGALIRAATADIANGLLAFDSQAFRIRSYSYSFLPNLLYWALRPRHGDKINPEIAASLITPQNRDAIQRAVQTIACGFVFDSTKKNESGNPSQSPGETSLSDSSTTAEVGTASAA